MENFATTTKPVDPEVFLTSTTDQESNVDSAGLNDEQQACLKAALAFLKKWEDFNPDIIKQLENLPN